MPIFKRFHQPARGQSDSRPNATPRSSEDGTLPIPKCCICGKEFPLRQSLAESFVQAGWNTASATPSGSGMGAALYSAVVCSQCESIACYPCAGFRPDTHPDGPNYSLICPKCGGEVIPLNSESYQALLAKQPKPKAVAAKSRKGKTAVRILIAHTGDDLETSDLNEIIKHVWDGQVAPNVQITSRSVTENPSSSDRQFAYVWAMWQQMLQYQYDEHPYWEDHQTYAYAGTITRTEQRFYLEIYYKD